MKEKCNGLGNTATYSLSEGAGTTNGVFYSGEDGGDFFTPDYVAIYPTATVRPFRFFVKGVAQVKDAMKHVSRQVSDVDNVDLSGKKMFFFRGSLIQITLFLQPRFEHFVVEI